MDNEEGRHAASCAQTVLGQPGLSQAARLHVRKRRQMKRGISRGIEQLPRASLSGGLLTEHPAWGSSYGPPLTESFWVAGGCWQAAVGFGVRSERKESINLPGNYCHIWICTITLC